MALNSFFEINMPYGMLKNKNGEWMAFNREYLPLGWTDLSQQESLCSPFMQYPVYSRFPKLTDDAIRDIFNDPDLIYKDNNGQIERVYFSEYHTPSPEYFRRLKMILEYKVE